VRLTVGFVALGACALPSAVTAGTLTQLAKMLLQIGGDADLTATLNFRPTRVRSRAG
jgi:hypothetical protein